MFNASSLRYTILSQGEMVGFYELFVPRRIRRTVSLRHLLSFDVTLVTVFEYVFEKALLRQSPASFLYFKKKVKKLL